MIQESKIVHQARLDFWKVEEEHKNHLRRLKTAVKLFNDNLILKDTEHILNSNVLHNGIECKIVHFDFRGSPYFMALFTLRPIKGNDDIGTGVGMRQVINF